MKLGKKTTIALLASITAFPSLGMDSKKTQTTSISEQERKTSSRTPQKSLKKTSEKSGFLAAVDQLISAKDEKDVHDAADEAMNLLHQFEDQIQALLNHYRAGEQKAYNKKAERQGFDYTRLYQYQEGYHHLRTVTPHTALGKLQNSTLNRKIQPLEQLLKDIHSLMSLLEQCRETGLAYVADKNNHIKHQKFTNLAGELISKYDILQESPLWMDLWESPEGFDLPASIGSDIFAPSLCPDHLIIGKSVTTLFPHFSIESWKHSFLTRDMRSRGPKVPMTQIRLQGKLWDVFADKEGETTLLPQQEIWDHTQMKMIPNPEYNVMKFLDEKNKSKICIYKFNAEAGQGHIQLPGQHWPQWGNLQKTYSIVLIPAKDQHPEPRDKSYDEVPNQLEEEIKGERLEGAEDLTNPKDRRKAVHEEMRQRLARRDFPENQTRRLHRRDIPMDQESEGYLMPSDIKDQTYGRVHVPDHRYGRTYERLYRIVPSVTADHEEMKAAQAIREHWEATEGHSLEGKSREQKDEGIAGGRGNFSQLYHKKGLSHDDSQNKNFNHVPRNKDDYLGGKEKEKRDGNEEK